MSMSKREQQEATDWFEEAARNPDQWEEVPRPPDAPAPRRKLGAQITIRLEPEVAERLREMAGERKIGYTSLARELLEDAILETTPDALLDGGVLHVVRREGLWALIREGERHVVYADADKTIVERWAHNIAIAERGRVNVHDAAA